MIRGHLGSMHSLRIVNKGFNYAQDGPGNRLVYHLFGCNMLCPWCANPEALFEGKDAEYLPPKEIQRQAISAKDIMIDSGESHSQAASLQSRRKLCWMHFRSCVKMI